MAPLLTLLVITLLIAAAAPATAILMAPAVLSKDPWLATLGMVSGSSVDLSNQCLTLAFDAATIYGQATQVSGSSACNLYSGQATPSPMMMGGAVSFNVGLTTRKACDLTVTTLETLFIQSLSQVTSYSISSDRQVLTLAGPDATWKFQKDGVCGGSSGTTTDGEPLLDSAPLLESDLQQTEPPRFIVENNGLLVENPDYGVPVGSYLENEQCMVGKACCVEDCCGVGTRWDSQKQACVQDSTSNGFQGQHSDLYDEDCKPLEGWACCEADCCDTASTFYDTDIDYCLGLLTDREAPAPSPSLLVLNPSLQTPSSNLVYCTDDVQQCPDGSYVSRDPNDDCNFTPCCCDAHTQELCLGDSEASCCPDGTWACPDDFGIVTCQGQATTTFGALCPDDPFDEPLFCTADVKQCPDGSYVSRDPTQSCQFEPCCCPQEDFPLCFIGTAQCCPDGSWSCPNGNTNEYLCDDIITTGPFGQGCPKTQCTKEAKACPDGSTVTRNPDLGCDFDPCCCEADREPGVGGNPACAFGHACCPDGTWTCGTGIEGIYNCDNSYTSGPFGDTCPTSSLDGGCPEDVRICSDGTTVGRVFENKCEFEACCCDAFILPLCLFGEPQCCREDGNFACPNEEGEYTCGGKTTTTGPFGQECDDLGLDLVLCPKDTKTCPGGTVVDRDPTNKCEFPLCPEPLFCTMDAKQCPDGSYVSRDPTDNCNFAPCCCDAAKEPGVNGNPLCFEGHTCCPDGTWTCGTGVPGIFVCDGEVTVGPFGETCV